MALAQRGASGTTRTHAGLQRHAHAHVALQAATPVAARLLCWRPRVEPACSLAHVASHNKQRWTVWFEFLIIAAAIASALLNGLHQNVVIIFFAIESAILMVVASQVNSVGAHQGCSGLPETCCGPGSTGNAHAPACCGCRVTLAEMRSFLPAPGKGRVGVCIVALHTAAPVCRGPGRGARATAPACQPACSQRERRAGYPRGGA